MQKKLILSFLSLMLLLVAIFSQSAHAQDGSYPAPVMISPSDGELLTYQTHPPLAIPNFAWEAVEGAEEYELWIAKTPSFPEQETEVIETDNTSYTPDKLLGSKFVDWLADGPFYWQVRVSEPELGEWPETFWTFTKQWGAPGNKPELLAPADGAKVEFFDYPTFEWTPVLGAAAYKLEVYMDPNMATLKGYVEGIPATTYQEEQKLENATYYWRIIPYDVGDNPGTPSDLQSFTMAYGTTELSKPQLITPTNGSEPLFTPTLEWEAVTGAEHYILQYSTDPNFPDDNSTFEEETNATSFTPDQRPNDENVYWRVRAVSGASESTWSEVWQFTKQWNIAPHLLTPTGGYPFVHAPPLLSWTPVPGAAYYKVEWASDEEFKVNLKTDYVVHPYYAFSKEQGETWLHLGKSEVWFWRVTPVSSNGNEGKASDSSFSMDWAFDDPAPELYFPRYFYEPSPMLTSRAVVSAALPIFGWSWGLSGTLLATSNSIVAPKARAPQYRLMVDTNERFEPPEWVVTTSHPIAVPSWTHGPFTPTVNQPYYWQVCSLDENGEIMEGIEGSRGGCSQVWKARFDPSLGLPVTTTTQPKLLRPIHGDQGVDAMPLLEWWPIAGATRYRVQIARDAAMSDIVEDGMAQYAAYMMTERLAYDTYYWRVQAQDADGPLGEWSVTQRFQVAALSRWRPYHPWEFTGPVGPLAVNIPESVLAQDAVGDVAGDADLSGLYAAGGLKYWNFGFEVVSPTVSPVTYVLLIDVDQEDNTGASVDPMYDLPIVSSHRPEYAISLVSDGGFAINTAWFYEYQSDTDIWERRTLASVGPSDLPVLSYMPFTATLDGFVQIKVQPGALNLPPSLSLLLISAQEGSLADSVPSENGGDLDAFATISDAPMLMAPPTNLSGDPQTYPFIPMLRWQPQVDAYAVGYNVQVSLDDTFPNDESRVVDSDDQIALGFSLSKANRRPGYLGDGTYYWRVGIFHKWNTSSMLGKGQYNLRSWRFEHVGFVPTEVKAELMGPMVTFSWDLFEGADQFYLEWDTNPDFSNPADVTIVNWRYTPLVFLAPGDYYWRVKPRYGTSQDGAFVNGGIFTSTIPVPTGLRVEPSTEVVSRTPTLTWDPVVYPTATPRFSAYRYMVEICENEGMSVNCQDMETEQHSWTPADDTFNDGELYWRVRAQVKIGFAPYNSDWKVGPSVTKQYERVELISPGMGETFSDVPTFVWKPLPGMAYYRISIDQEKSKLDSLSPWVKAWTASQQYTPIKDYESDAGGTYYWRVCGVDQDGIEGPCSDREIVVEVYSIYLPLVVRES